MLCPVLDLQIDLHVLRMPTDPPHKKNNAGFARSSGGTSAAAAGQQQQSGGHPGAIDDVDDEDLRGSQLADLSDPGVGSGKLAM